jgi:glutamate/tyrosine decarboxylase-like PLP-dependent enzyme
MSDERVVNEIRGQAARVLEKAQKLAVEHLESQSDRPVAERAGLEELRASFCDELPEEGESPLETIDYLATQAEPGLVASTGPRFFGFVIGGSLPVGVAADWLTAAWDQNSGLYAVAPAVSVIEEAVSDWLLDLLELPPDASVGFVTGCQMANFTALAAARNELLRREGWEVEGAGLYGAPVINVVLAQEAHATIHTSLRMLGLGGDRVSYVECDGQGRMIPTALESCLAGLDGPSIVCAQAGNVNSGAFDPLRAVVEISRRSNAWVHVDGAFGLWAALSPAHRELVDGCREADSWSTDAHKWLNVPYDSGIVFVADAAAHRRAMSVDASYLKKSGAARDPLDWVPEFSRRGRGVPVWATLRSLGRKGIRELVERCCEGAVRMAEVLAEHQEVEILNDVVLNQVLVRFGGEGERGDRLTGRVIRQIQEDGVCWLGGTNWRGRPAMRVSVSNWSTTRSDVERSARAVLSALEVCLREEQQ